MSLWGSSLGLSREVMRHGLNTRKCLSYKGKSDLRRTDNPYKEGTSKVKSTQWRP
jgi:hypothetical protein